MPIIPVYKRQYTIPSGRANALGDVRSAGIVGESIAQAGNTLFSEITKTIEKQQAEQDAIDLINYDNQHDTLIRDYEIKQKTEKQGATAIGITKSAQADLEQLTNDLIKKLPERLQAKALKIFTERNNHVLDKFATYEMEQGKVYREQTIQNTSDLATQQIVENYDSPFDVNNIIARHTAKLESLNVPQHLIVKANSGLLSSAIQAAMNYEDVDAARALMLEHKTVLNATGVYDNLEKQLKTVEKSTLVQRTYNKLYDKNNGDFNAMRQFINNPENQRQLGLDMNQTLFLNQKITDAQTAKNKETAAAQDQEATQIVLNLDKFNPYQIDKLVDQGKLSFKQGEIFKQQLLRGDVSTDAQAWFEAYNKSQLAAGNPEALIEARDFILAHGFAISNGDKKFLISNTLDNQDKSAAQAIRKGMAYIKSIFMPSRTSISLNNTQQENKFLEAGKAFDDAVKKAKKDGLPINNETIEKISREIVNNYSSSVYDFASKSSSHIMPVISSAFQNETEKALSVVYAESGGNPKAINKNTNGSTDYGLFQINSLWIPELKRVGIINNVNDLLEVGANVNAAKYIYDKAGGTFDKDWAASKKNWSKTSGKKLIGYSKGQPVYDLGNGKWQIGE